MANSLHKDLYVLIDSVRDREGLERLLIDLLSPAEIDNIAERWHIMKQIAAGRSHRAIAKSIGTSIAKVSRCARVVKYGNGAIRECLQKLRRLNKTSKN